MTPEQLAALSDAEWIEAVNEANRREAMRRDRAYAEGRKKHRRKVDRACYAGKADLRWQGHYNAWLDRMRGKHGASWTPGPLVDTWRKWRNRRQEGR
jgi:hypothetical protein